MTATLKGKPMSDPSTDPIAQEAAYRAARAAYTDACHTMASQQHETVHTDNGPRIATLESRYNQLRAALPGDQGSQHGNVARSMPPIRTDVATLLAEIDRGAAAWAAVWGLSAMDSAEKPTGEHPTVTRLWALDGRNWRPQDAGWLAQAAHHLAQWADAIDTLLDPPRPLDLAAPCPACGERYAYRPDDAGDNVRSAALVVTPQGCRCQNCRTVWAPEYFQHLARVLQCKLPAGILE